MSGILCSSCSHNRVCCNFRQSPNFSSLWEKWQRLCGREQHEGTQPHESVLGRKCGVADARRDPGAFGKSTAWTRGEKSERAGAAKLKQMLLFSMFNTAMQVQREMEACKDPRSCKFGLERLSSLNSHWFEARKDATTCPSRCGCWWGVSCTIS